MSFDAMEVSLLTCSPGPAIYELYGHTAIRMNNPSTGEDWVFNYGMFSFNRPHFVWRFVRGECDYQIGAVPFAYFAREYAERGSAVYQQDLNLTPEEKERLWNLLLENMRPENRVYRYNFLYDNCTTRARDRIEEAIAGVVVYPEPDTLRSFREIIHQYTRDYPWAELGDDLCLGAEADRPVSVREQMFAPFYLLRYADEAVIRDSAGGERPLVLRKSEVVLAQERAESSAKTLSPAWCAWLLLAAVAVLTAVERRRRCCFWWADALLMTATGLAGIVVTYLFFFSVHPTVDSNWQIWVFNPLPLLAMPRVVWCAVRRKKTCYHAVNIVVLTSFVIFSIFIPQDFCAVVVPLALALLLRSCSYWMSYRKENKIKD